MHDTSTAEAIYALLSFESNVHTWGNEVYFSVPISNQVLEESAKDVVKVSELAFWVEGNCIAFGFGPTPLSHGDEIRIAARTNIWAHADYDLTKLKNVNSGDTIHILASKDTFAYSNITLAQIFCK